MAAFYLQMIDHYLISKNKVYWICKYALSDHNFLIF